MRTSTKQKSIVAPGIAPVGNEPPQPQHRIFQADRSVSEDDEKSLDYDIHFSDETLTSLPGTGLPFGHFKPLAGKSNHLMGHGNLSALAVSLDADARKCRERHSTSAVQWLDFLSSDEMLPVLQPYLEGDHKVIADYGCGADARLGVLLMNRLRLTDSNLLGIETNKRHLDLVDKSFPPQAHHTNLFYRLEGDYLKSTIAGVDINVGNLEWSLEDPLPFITAVQNMLGCATVTLIIVPRQLAAAIKRLIEQSFSKAASPELVERRISLKAGLRSHGSLRTFHGSFLCVKGGVPFLSPRKIRAAIQNAHSLYLSRKAVSPRNRQMPTLSTHDISPYYTLLDTYRKALGSVYSRIWLAGEPIGWMDNDVYNLNTKFRRGVHVQWLVYFRPNKSWLHQDFLSEDESFELLRQHLWLQSQRPNTTVAHITRAVRFFDERYASFELRTDSTTGDPPLYDECRDPELKGVKRWTAPKRSDPPPRQSNFVHCVYDTDWDQEKQIITIPPKLTEDISQGGVNLNDSNNWDPRAVSAPDFIVQSAEFQNVTQVQQPRLHSPAVLSESNPPSATDNSSDFNAPASRLEYCQGCEELQELLQNEIAQREDEKAKLQSQLQGAHAKLQLKNVEVDRLTLTHTSQLTAHTEDSQSQQAVLELLRGETVSLRESIQLLTEQNSELEIFKNTHAGLKHSVSLLTNARDELTHLLQSEQSLREKDQQLSRQEISRLESINCQSDQQLADCRRNLFLVQQQYNAILPSLETATADLEAERQRFADSQLALSTASLQETAILLQLESLQTQLAQEKDASILLVERLHQQDLAAQTAMLSKEQSLTAELAKYQRDLASAQSSIADLTSRLTASQHEAHKLHLGSAVHEQKLHHLQTSIRELETSLESSDQTFQGLAAAHQQLSDTMDQTSRLLQQTVEDRDNERTESMRRLKDYQSASDQLSAAQAQLMQLKSNSDTAVYNARSRASYIEQERHYDALASLLCVLQSVPNSFSVLGIIRSLRVFTIDAFFAHVLAQDSVQIVECIILCQPWITELANIQRLGSEDHHKYLGLLIRLHPDDQKLAKTLVDLVAARADSLSLEFDYLSAPLHLASAIRQWMSNSNNVCKDEYLLRTIEQETLDLLQVEVNNTYWFAFGKPIQRQDFKEYHDGLGIIKCFAQLTGSEKQVPLTFSRDMTYANYLLSLGVITSALPSDLVKDIYRLLHTHYPYHKLLQALFAGNTVTYALHNLLFVAAVLYMSQKDWDSVLSDFQIGEVNEVYRKIQISPSTLPLSLLEITQADIYVRCDRVPVFDAGSDISLCDLKNCAELYYLFGRYLGLYFSPICLASRSAVSELMASFLVIRFATEYQEAKNCNAALDTPTSLISQISTSNYTAILQYEETLIQWCITLRGEMPELALQASSTVNDPSQACCYSRRVPGLIPLWSMTKFTPNGPHYDRCIDILEELCSQAVFKDFGQVSRDECDNLLQLLIQMNTSDSDESVHAGKLRSRRPPGEEFSAPLKPPAPFSEVAQAHKPTLRSVAPGGEFFPKQLIENTKSSLSSLCGPAEDLQMQTDKV